MIIRLCDRCGKKEQADSIRIKTQFKKYGSEDQIDLEMKIDFSAVDLCCECAAWVIQQVVHK